LVTWASDPWTRGSYVAFDREGWERVSVLREPVDGRVFFAGEHTAGAAAGTMNGAVESGMRAAGQVATRFASS
jgi:monoamine oxidase